MNKIKINTRLVLRTDKKKADGKCPIYYLVSFNGKSFKTPSGLSVLESDWDNNRKKIKSNALENSKLTRDIARFREHFLREEVAGKKIIFENIKNYFSNVDTHDFYEFYEKYIKRRRKELSEETYDKYVTTLKILREFKSQLNFADIDYNFIVQFDYYLREDRNNKGGATNRHKNLRTVIKDAINCGIKVEYPYSRFKVKHHIPKTNFLPLEEIDIINELGLPDNKLMLREVRHMFVFSCYTGLRFSDIIALKWEEIDISKTMLEKIQKKTKKKVTVGLCKKAIRILQERITGKNKNENVFLPISNQKANSNLKKLAKLAKIDKRLTYHMARHSYGSNLAEKNVNLSIISSSMGHSSIKDTQRYAKVRPQVLIATVALFD